MSKFRPKLARYNTICCDQVMPVPVIPVCAVSCCLPRPICEYKAPLCPPPPPPPPAPTGCNPPQSAIDSAVLEAPIITSPIKIPQYNPCLPNPPPGTILTIVGGALPSGYLFADGSEISRTIFNALYMAIGTYYGEGDGSTTFNLPNLICEDGLTSYIIKT